MCTSKYIDNSLAVKRKSAKGLIDAGFVLERWRRAKPMPGKRTYKFPQDGRKPIVSVAQMGEDDFAAARHSQSSYVCIDVDNRYFTSPPPAIVELLRKVGVLDWYAYRTPSGGWHFWFYFISAYRPAAQEYIYKGLHGEFRQGASVTLIYDLEGLASFVERDLYRHSYRQVERLRDILLADNRTTAEVADMDRADSQSPPRDAVEKVIAMLCPLASPRPRRDPSAHNADWKNPAVSNPGLHWNRLAYTEVLLGRQQTWHNLHGDALKAAHSGAAVAEHDLQLAHDRARVLLKANDMPVTGKKLDVLAAFLALIGRQGVLQCWASHGTIADMAGCCISTVQAWKKVFIKAGILNQSGYKKHKGKPGRASATWNMARNSFDTCVLVLSVAAKRLLGFAAPLDGQLFLFDNSPTNSVLREGIGAGSVEVVSESQPRAP